jgi:hypothetical protein
MSKKIPKPREYTADNPLVIQIILRPSGVWTIQPHPNHHAKMKGRLNDPDTPPPPGKVLKDRILDEWKARNPKKPKPDFLADAEHIPIIIRQGEFVRFECVPQRDFEIFAEKNQLVDPDPNAPLDPFGWNGLHQSVVLGGSITAAVLLPPVDASGNPTGPCPKDQGFYKFRAEVDPAGAAIPVDPDGYCDG